MRQSGEVEKCGELGCEAAGGMSMREWSDALWTGVAAGEGPPRLGDQKDSGSSKSNRSRWSSSGGVSVSSPANQSCTARP